MFKKDDNAYIYKLKFNFQNKINFKTKINYNDDQFLFLYLFFYLSIPKALPMIPLSQVKVS